MPVVPQYLVRDALKQEGDVTVSWDKRSRCYYARFRFSGRQYARTTGETDPEKATAKAAEIFAEVVRGPVQALTLATLQSEIAELKTLVLQLAAGGTNHRNPHVKVEIKTLGEAAKAFAAARIAKAVASSNETRLQRRIQNFVEFIGEGLVLPELTVEHIDSWRNSRPELSPRAQKNDVAAVAQLLRWAGSPPRRWCDPELAKGVELPAVARTSTLPEIITASQAETLMRTVESTAPQYILFYAIALFGGVRSNKKDTSDDTDGGEIIRLFESVKKEGWYKYFNDLVLRIPRGKVRGEPRQVHTPDCLKAWLRAYPEALEVPQRAWHTRNISGPLSLPKNALRHTAASAFISSGGEFGRAAMLFQSSESTLKKHYVNLMTPDQAQAFWQIYPAEKVNAEATAS